jgi:eukaryotic-like serine/threonine-protein kinase
MRLGRRMTEPERPDVPGYLIGDLLGVGGSGTVWAAVDQATGARVAVKVLAAQANSVDSVHSGFPGSELAVLRGLAHRHVVRLHGDLTLPDGRIALVLELVDGGSLEQVTRARGHLTPGETSTILVALAGTAADLHRCGVTHADLSPRNVLFHSDGRPMLADLGLAKIAGDSSRSEGGTDGFVDPAVLSGAAAEPASDVYALGALAWFGLTGRPPGHPALRPALAQACPSVPPALVRVIEAALDPDPVARPQADELAHSVYAACRPEPVQLAGVADPGGQLTRRIRALAAADPPAEMTSGRRRRPRVGWVHLRRGVRPLGAALMVVLVVVAVARLWPRLSASGSEPPRAQVRSAPSAAATPWPAVVQALAQDRVAAFATSPSPGPAGFDAPGSAAWRADQADLEDLRRAGLHYAGVHLTATPAGSVVPLATPAAATQIANGQSVSLTVRVVTSAYDVVDETGRVHERRPASSPVLVTLRLVRTVAGWRVADTS